MSRIDYHPSDRASKGRNGDRFLAHVMTGEMIVPPVISDELRERLYEEMEAAGIPIDEYTVGEGMSINPLTGLPEFGFGKFVKKAFKSVKKVASVALPIAAAFIPGVGPLASAALTAGAGALGSKIAGNSWSDALKSGALSGFLNIATPVVGNAISSIAPKTAGALGIQGGYDTVFGGNFGALSGAAPSGAAASGALSAGTENFIKGLPTNIGGESLSPAFQSARVASGLDDVAAIASNEGALSGILSKIQEKPITALTAAATLANAFGDSGSSQQDLLNQAKAQQAQEAAMSKKITDLLNSSVSGRSALSPTLDYYTYGQRPEALFFDKVNSPITYGALS